MLSNPVYRIIFSILILLYIPSYALQVTIVNRLSGEGFANIFYQGCADSAQRRITLKRGLNTVSLPNPIGYCSSVYFIRVSPGGFGRAPSRGIASECSSAASSLTRATISVDFGIIPNRSPQFPCKAVLEKIQ